LLLKTLQLRNYGKAEKSRQFLSYSDNDEAALAKHFAALSTNIEACIKFGIANDRFSIFGLGRRSLLALSVIGLSIAGLDWFGQLFENADGANKWMSISGIAPFQQNIRNLALLVSGMQTSGRHQLMR